MIKIFHISSLLLIISLSASTYTHQEEQFFANCFNDAFRELESFEKIIHAHDQFFDEFVKRSDLQINMHNDQTLNEVHIKVRNIHDSKDLQASYENDILKITTPQELIYILFKNNVLTVDVQQQISHNNAITDDNFTKESISNNVFASHAQQCRTLDGKIDLAQSKVSYKKDARELIIAIPHQHSATTSIPVAISIEE